MWQVTAAGAWCFEWSFIWNDSSSDRWKVPGNPPSSERDKCWPFTEQSGHQSKAPVMELIQIFELIFTILMGSDNISVSFLLPVDLLFQDVCACVCMEWHWELVVTYEFQYQYIRRCSHLDEPLGLSLPDSDWYHLINMQGHRGEGERGDALLLLLIVSIFTDPQIFLDITQRQLTARMLYKVSDCETNLQPIFNTKNKNLS